MREGVADQRGADEAGADPVAVTPGQPGQPVAHGLNQVASGDAELDGECVAGLGVGQDASGGGDVFGEPRLPDLFGVVGVVGGVVGVAEQGGGLGEQVGGFEQVRAGDEVVVGFGLAGVVGWGVGVDPVAELEAAFPQVPVAGTGQQLVDPPLHGRILHLQHLQVAEPLVEVPGQDDRHVTPGGGGHLGRVEHVRHDEGHPAGVLLFEGEVDQPRGEKAVAVEEITGGGAEHLDVAGPAEPFVALGQSVGR